jgi:hypothetical protein
MKVKYLSDTDTSSVEFSDLEVAETKEINEKIHIEPVLWRQEKTKIRRRDRPRDSAPLGRPD